ncbi:flavin reductase family protein [Amycolatopsis cihanbeyliensis]|uniref:Flavin reductase (DIM6/NTAB) family NADH-FMN oxidoreductase RutF n=1 Tax=Amycolatopsis cihanbeyliensis TaxID=1128664 RepID=A0A542DBM2_AMYCI|nr:flavin reductase family protein [Amycolatopsis cihanbeyliensis]TQJ00455.1 flavin reductase (DIM6/NTAB) family NADH-FMN oxidoreductase RutF [Amycolatopsis cihanbeyliensis]
MPGSTGFLANVERRHIDEADFRQLMSYFPSGVAVVTTLDPDGNPRGLTCTSLCSVSTTPPTMLVCLHRQSSSFAAVRARGAFAVNLLNDQGAPIARTFAKQGADRFAGIPWQHTTGLRMPWLTQHAHSMLECTVDRYIDAADHMVVFGRVRQLEHTGQPPLLYGQRRFAGWQDTTPC